MVVDVDTENKYILVSGNVPGAKNSYVFIKEAIKGSKYDGAVELVSYEEGETVTEEAPANEVVNNEAVVEETVEETPTEEVAEEPAAEVVEETAEQPEEVKEEDTKEEVSE